MTVLAATWHWSGAMMRRPIRPCCASTPRRRPRAPASCCWSPSPPPLASIAAIVAELSVGQGRRRHRLAATWLLALGHVHRLVAAAAVRVRARPTQACYLRRRQRRDGLDFPPAHDDDDTARLQPTSCTSRSPSRRPRRPRTWRSPRAPCAGWWPLQAVLSFAFNTDGAGAGDQHRRQPALSLAATAATAAAPVGVRDHAAFDAQRAFDEPAHRLRVDAHARSPARGAASVCASSPGSTGTTDCSTIGPWSSSAVTKCTVAPASLQPASRAR